MITLTCVVYERWWAVPISQETAEGDIKGRQVRNGSLELRECHTDVYSVGESVVRVA